MSATIVVTATVLALAALLHPAFGAHKLFGIYQPSPDITARHLAPLMNPNNLAGYLNVGICLSFASALAQPGVIRIVGGAVALLLGATQLWVASRGGVLTMGLGVAIVFAIARFAHARRRNAAGIFITVTAGLAVVGAVLIVLAGSDDASEELLTGDVSKLAIFSDVARMLRAMAVFGCGRGAFESAFPAFRTIPGYVTYAYPENILFQWLVEWGAIVGTFGLAALSYALRPSAVLARSTTASGAWAALVALGVQNLADLGSEVPALALAGTCCAAIVAGGVPGHASRWRVEAWSRFPRHVALAGGLAAFVATVVTAISVRRELHREEDRLHDVAMGGAGDAKSMHDEVRATMLRHPAEPYFPFVTAQEL